MYRIPINFRCFVGYKEINLFMREVGAWSDGEGLGTEVTVTVTGSFPDILDMEQVKEIGNTYMQEFNKVAAEQKKDIELLSCTFESFGAIKKLPENG